MTKTKGVDVHNSPTRLFFASHKERRLHLRQKMESGGGTEGSDGVQKPHAGPGHQDPRSDAGELSPALSAQPSGEKKINRAPSPARPKDVSGWSLTKIRGGIGTPTLSVKPGAIHLGSRVSRRSPIGSLGGKEGKSERSSGAKPTGKSFLSTAPLSKAKTAKGRGRKKLSDSSVGSDEVSKDSGCATGKLSPTDSSSELSDCASEENKLSADAVSSDAESRSSRCGGPDGDKPLKDGAFGDRANKKCSNKTTCTLEEKEQKDRLSLGAETGEGSPSPLEERSATSLDSRMPASTSLAFSDLTEEFIDGMHEEFVREIEELRSENDYLKDEMEELRSEMLEMRDMYMEEDVYQLQELRQQLEQANKTCRILQYRLRKAERRSIRVAQTGQVDGELIRSLEQDVKVAKDISIRLHSQLDSVEKKRSRLEQENEDMRVRLQDLEVAKQVLQQEIDKNTQKKRGARPNNKPDKKPGPQEDSSDLKCQLHFAKEESALMCKKLTKLVKDSEAMKEELTKYRSLYGDVNVSLSVEEVADSPHTREAEVRIHLKLVEEEANLLSRRIVELEVENRGLRAEMDDMKGPQDGSQELNGVSGGPGADLGQGGGAMVLAGGASSENVMELQRHLQFVEEEAELLRRSLIEMEEQNKLLMNEINRYKSELPLLSSPLSSHSLTSLTDGLLTDSSMHSIQEGAVLISTDSPAQEEELRLARLQIGELSGKVKKLQYENRVLLSNLQRCDLASYHVPSFSSSSLRLALDTDAEAGDSAECLPNSPPHRKEPVGGENDAMDIRERKMKMEDNTDATTSLVMCLGQNDHDSLLAMRDQARLVSTAIQLLTSPESNCLSMSSTIYHKVCSNNAAEPCDLEKPQLHSQILALSDLADRPLVGALTSRLQALHSQLQAFIEQVDNLGKPPAGRRDSQLEGESPLASPCTSLICSGDGQDGLNSAEENADSRDQSESDVKDQAEAGSQLNISEPQTQENTQLEHGEKEADVVLLIQSSDLQAGHSHAEEAAHRCEKDLEKEELAQGDTFVKIKQLQAEHQKVLLRRDFQLQSLGLQLRLQQKLWSQERTLLVQESQHLKQALLVLSLKLRCFLKQWRLGCKDTEWKDILEMNSLKDLYLLLEEENLPSPSHQTDKRAATDEQASSPNIKSSAVSSTLADLKVALQDLSGELRQERQGSQELTQQFAKAKVSWEVERTELKSVIMQLETKTGKAAATLAAADALEPPDLKVALKKEREEHQHLLAESYAAVMDLTKQLQIGNRNWSREKLELLERFSQERTQWEQRLRDATTQQGKEKSFPGESSSDTVVANSTGSQRLKSLSELNGSEVSRTANQEERFQRAPPFSFNPHLGDLTKKNWTYLTNETPEVRDTCKTWDGPCSSLMVSQLYQESVQRSYTAPDRTGIRIYYSPPAVRRMEHRRRDQEAKELQQAQNDSSSLVLSSSDASVPVAEILEVQQPTLSFSSSYEQWLSSLSKQHKELLESRSGCVPSSFPGILNNSIGGSTNSLSEGLTPSSGFHDLEIGEISANLSDDMKEMTNCVRQAIRSSSLERKSPKETGSQAVSMATRSTQTASHCVSIGLQTDVLSSSRGTGLHSTKPWSPRPSSTTTSSLTSARTRQISTSLDKVHGRIERPCCSPKYGSPKLQRRVSSGSTSRLDGASSSRDRSLWSLQQRSISGGGSAWARSTTTRDSPVLSGLTDGLSSLFSVVEHSGSTESLWRGDGGASQVNSPARQTPAAGKPSVVAVCGPEPNSQRYGGLVQEFFRNVCNSRAQGGLPLPVDRVQRESLGCLGVLGPLDEPKTECISTEVGGQGALAGFGGGNDSVTKIVNKRLMRQTAGEEMVGIMGGGKEITGNAGSTGSGTEDAPCDCAAQSSCLARPVRIAARLSLVQCKHRPQESPVATEENGDTSNE
ncbi:microtubule cross-linking factor 2 isoform X2 [Antennarius striatus]|uniref:microtubule cross-linking factor 2 isoform X2 n=1 Tax=Antennarius striatus TaxID=241820 RepID=UPI0035B03639